MDISTADRILVDFKGAAELLSVSPSGLRNLNNAGKVPKPRKLGGRCLFDVSELRAWSKNGCPSRLIWEQNKVEND